MNRPPQPADRWWSDHQTKCGGTYHKIAEPEKPPPEKKEKEKAGKKRKASAASSGSGSGSTGQRGKKLKEDGENEAKNEGMDSSSSSRGKGTDSGGTVQGRQPTIQEMLSRAPGKRPKLENDVGSSHTGPATSTKSHPQKTDAHLPRSSSPLPPPPARPSPPTLKGKTPAKVIVIESDEEEV
ncbi:hypothetical protein HK102_000126, partial [Quaeritorhiza haematococci]